MSSPLRSSDRSRSSPRSTPSHNASNGLIRANGYHQSLRESTHGSPSRQLLEEFGRMLMNDDRAFQRSLDERTSAQQKLHLEALDRALAKHEEVRESAERARERVELEIEQERRRKIEEERKAIEKARRDLEEQKLAEQRRRLEEEKAREEQRRRQEALQREQEAFQKAQEETKRRADAEKQQAEEERARKARQEKDQEDQRARQDAEARERQQQAQRDGQAATKQPTAPSSQPNGILPAQPTPLSSQAPAPSSQPAQAPANLPKGLVSSSQEREAIHARYIDLHQRLKRMRVNVLEEVSRVPGLKNQLSDWRRAIQKCCGQLARGTSDDVKASNKRAITEIMRHLDAAAGVAEPSLDVTQYLVENRQPPNANKQGPACLVFLLNHLAKKIMSQFISESSVDARTAEPLGILAVTVFARPQYLFNGQSLIDILWAKYHKDCPILFGISGSERTQEGRAKLGWEFFKDANSYAPIKRHFDNMSGLGAGFAAITLRDFKKSQNANPAPNRIYWESIARILNTPANQTQPTHFVILKAMIDNYVPRIISTFGGAGLAVLREALIIFPRDRGPQDEKGRKVPAVAAVQSLPAVLQRDLDLSL